AGTMRSTMVEGKATLAATQAASAGERASMKAVTTERKSEPFEGRLSQLMIVMLGAPAFLRRSNAKASRPSTVAGAAAPSRSRASAGLDQSSAPVAGMWQ